MEITRVFQTRDELIPWLINTFNLQHGIEVGVRDGCFSKVILDNTHKNFRLLGVDIYKTIALENFMKEYIDRFACVFNYSHHIAEKIPDDSIELIHIDAGHTYYDVKLDLESWWPKVKVGGFFTGDDYCICSTPNEGEYGIVQAVEEWAAVNNLSDKIYLTQAGYVNINERRTLANFRGMQVEDNLRKMYEPHRPYHENAHVPTWLIRKC